MCHINENAQDDSKCYVLYKHVLNLLFLEFFGIGLHRFWEPVNAQTLRMHFFRTLKQYEHIRDRTRFRYFALYGFPIQFRLCFYTLGENAFNWENTQESSLVSPSHTFIHPNGAEISERAHFHCKIIRLKSFWIGASELDYCSIEAVYPFCIPQKLETLTMHEP